MQIISVAMNPFWAILVGQTETALHATSRGGEYPVQNVWDGRETRDREIEVSGPRIVDDRCNNPVCLLFKPHRTCEY